ncbi:MAG: hypothetical protein AAGA70_12835 [Pseudomonadota bacterium]
MTQTLKDLEPLKPAEQAVLDNLWDAPEVSIGTGELPEEVPTEEVIIRAGFVRYLCLYYDKLPEWGLGVFGASIEGELGLEGTELKADLLLANCRFDTALKLRSAELKSIYLNGSHLPGLDADGLSAKGDFSLRGATATAQVRMLGGKLGGDLNCIDATLAAEDTALNCDRLETGGEVFLRHADVTGAVRLLGARIGGDLTFEGAKLSGGEAGVAVQCDKLWAGGGVFLRSAEVAGAVRFLGTKLGASFNADRVAITSQGSALQFDGAQIDGDLQLRHATIIGAVRILGARISGDLTCRSTSITADGDAINATNAQINGTFFMRSAENENPLRLDGHLDLRAARISVICDEPRAWPEPGSLWLDRCTYDAFIEAPVSAKDRIDWLDRQPEHEFHPQPWEQCARVLRDTGHGQDAKRLMIEKEGRHRRHRRALLRASGQWDRLLLATVWDGILASTVRYGREPFLALFWLVGFAVLGAFVFNAAYQRGLVHPTGSSVLGSVAWQACGPEFGVADTQRTAPDETRVMCYNANPDAEDLPRFPPLMFTLDTLLPVMSFDVRSKWEVVAPPGDRLWLVYFWVQIVVGWALSLLAVAGFSGLVKSE